MHFLKRSSSLCDWSYIQVIRQTYKLDALHNQRSGRFCRRPDFYGSGDSDVWRHGHDDGEREVGSGRQGRRVKRGVDVNSGIILQQSSHRYLRGQILSMS